MSVLLGSRPPNSVLHTMAPGEKSAMGVAVVTSSFNIDFGEWGRWGMHGNTIHLSSATDMSLFISIKQATEDADLATSFRLRVARESYCGHL